MAGMNRGEPTREQLQARIDDLEDRHTVDQQLIARLEADGSLEREKVANLETALTSARRIGAAIGIVMSLRKVTDREAFTLLSELSQRTNRKLRDVADEVLFTGTLPVGESAGPRP